MGSNWFSEAVKMASFNFRRGLILLNMKKQTAIKKAALSTSGKALGGGVPKHFKDYNLHGGEKQHLPIGVDIGTREVVGFGVNGTEMYVDDLHHPFPAIRFKEDTPEILKIKEKEKGDWKKMTIHEKKELYRASFCSTLAEIQAGNPGEWKSIWGTVFFTLALTLFYASFLEGLNPYTGRTRMNEEWSDAAIQRMVDMEMNKVQGISSHYDYEKNEWK